MKRFSLVELLAILAVVALLVGIFLPVFTRQRQPPYRMYCAGNLKQIGLAMLMYSGDNKAHFPLTAPGNNFEPLNTQMILMDGKVYGCPARVKKQAKLAAKSDYWYRGCGLKDDNISATAITMAFDMSGNHPQNAWMNALFIDGHVEGARPNGSKPWNKNPQWAPVLRRAP